MPRAIRDPNAPLRPMTFSASRIERWINCNRKAGWQYIAGYEDLGTGATDFGVTVHAVLESYKRDGIPPNTMTDEGALASEALPHVEDFILPPAGNAQIEGYFVLQGRHKWQGYKDLSKPGHVLDYKTSSNIAKWAKTPDVLMTDPQAVLYAAHALTQEPALAAVKLTWLYLSKRRPYKAHPVDVVMTREHAMRAFAALETIADEFDAAAALAPPDPPGRHRFVLDTLQPNLSHCDSYGGCPHKARCGISFFSNPENVRHERTNMDLLARLQEMDRVQAAGGDPLARPAADAPLQTMRGVPTPFQTPQMQPPEKGATPALAFAPGGAFAGLGPTTVAPVVQHTATGANTFNPGFLMAPDAPAANDAPVAAAAPTTERMLPIAAPIPAAEFVEPGPGATAVAPGQINPPKRAGRPKGSKNKATLEAEAAQVAAVGVAPTIPAPAPTVPATPAALSVAPVVVVAPTAQQVTTPPEPAAKHRITCLFVGCLPRGVDVGTVNLDDIVAKAKVAIGPAELFKNYGYKANGMLLQMVEAIVQYDRPRTVVVAHPSSPEATLCLSHLLSISDVVVEALR